MHQHFPKEDLKKRMLFDNHHQHCLIVIGRARPGEP
jgi:hypothetical protein